MYKFIVVFSLVPFLDDSNKKEAKNSKNETVIEVENLRRNVQGNSCPV